MNPFMLVLIVAPFLGACLVPIVAKRWRSGAAWVTAGSFAVSLFALMALTASHDYRPPLVTRLTWLPEWGLDLALRLDGLGVLFVLLICGIGILVTLYAAYYLPATDPLGRFFAVLLVFAGSMLGIVLSENVLLMLSFWEMTSITSFLLIAHDDRKRASRMAARLALAMTGGGGLALFAGLLVLGHIAGSFELSDILARADTIRAHPFYPLALVLVLIGAFTKSAQVPFHAWLPSAMAAPTPVSAYLHSATMVKAGVFLLARLYPALSGTDLWFVIVSSVGGLTFAYGAYIALHKHDLKGLLAYSTISHLGLITLLFGLDTPLSAVAAVFHIINHAIFKASLFMAAGIIDHECGTRDMRRINGLFKYMPYTASLGIVAAASMAGVPLMNGFLSKEMFFAEVVGHPALQGLSRYFIPTLVTLAGALSVAYSARFVHDVFFNGEPVNLPRTPHEPPLWMRVPVDVLVVLVVLVGVAPNVTVAPLLSAAARAVLASDTPDFTLAVWHGFNLPLLMSAVAFIAGFAYYAQRSRLFRFHDRVAWKRRVLIDFERCSTAMTRVARSFLDAVDRRTTRYNVTLLLCAVLAGAAWAWMRAPMTAIEGPEGKTPIDAAGLAALVALAVGSAGAVLFHRQRLTAVMFLSVVGLIVALTFVRFAAPDLALTQLSVEVVTIVLLLLVLRFVPGEAPPERNTQRMWRDAALATLCGVGACVLAFAMLTRPFETISDYHLANAKPGGGGTNVVNVILVDFRGFDTLGEIAVLAMAAWGLHAAVSGLRLTPHALRGASAADRHPIMLAMLSRPLLPLGLTVAAFLFLRGHNMPGGGFVAGLIAAVALMLQYLASGQAFAQERARIDFARLTSAGLAIAIGTGIASWIVGFPFLTSTFAYIKLPVIEQFEIASAMAFDLGVFLTVLGSVLLILTTLGALSQRELADSRPAGSPHRSA